jgi:hypothetical protein
VHRYDITRDGECLPISTDSFDLGTQFNSGGVVALSADQLGQEGLAGTQDGSIFYFNFNKDQHECIPLVRRLSSHMDCVKQI